jgi:serine/threonine protein kinase
MVLWKTTLAVLGITVNAARVDKSALSLDVNEKFEAESGDELFVNSAIGNELFANLTSQIGFSLGKLDFENDAALAADAPVRSWDKELDKDYKFERMLACGFHGCAFLARNKADNREEVIKISSSGDGNQGAGAEECGRAREVQYRACGAGEAAMKAAQSYLPSCDGYGTLKSGGGYVVLPMAGGTDFNHFGDQLKKAPLPIEVQKSIFAQLVAGIYALHKGGISHNDMHGKNVLINKDNEVAIVDFGLGTTYPCSKSRNQNGYARDGNMLYAYTAMVGNCGSKNQWPGVWIGFVTDNNSYRRKQARCMEVLKENWGIDAEFENALQKVWTANVERDTDQHIEGLFNTKFVQKNLPKSSTRFQLRGTDQCHKWDKAKLKHEMEKAGSVAYTCDN